MKTLKKIYTLGKLTLMKKYKEQELKNHELKYLFWECTGTCNMSCKHCFVSAKKKVYDEELKTEEIKNTFKQIADGMEAGKIFIGVSGGEPLLRKDLCEVMKYASDLGFHWGLNTNGVLLNDKMIKNLKNANLESISISIDGLEQTHNDFRNFSDAYKIVIKNIQKLREVNFLKHIRVETSVSKDNILELEALYKLMISLNLDSWKIASIDPCGRAEENKNLFLNGKDLKYLLDFIVIKNKEKKVNIEYESQGFLGIEYEGQVRKSCFFCRAGINVASILWNGDIFSCLAIPKVKHLIQGNVRTDNFVDVWNNKYKEFRTFDRMRNSECENCENWEYCFGGSLHTWDFEKNRQKKCPYKMMKESDSPLF